MNPTIIEPTEEIIAHAKRETMHYRQLVSEKRTAEDEMLARCYREQARGKTLLDVAQSIQDAGLNEQGLPVLGHKVSW